MIYSALLKKGYSNFTLEILEYCDSADLLKREQYYIDKLNPEYNILKTAGSSLGFKHSDETRAKISNSLAGERNPMFGLKHSDEIRAKISNSLAGERNPMFGKTESQSPRFGKQHSSETRAKISIFKAGKPRPQGAGKSSQPVEVIDIKNNIKTIYDSISAAALALGIKSATISKYFSNDQKKPYNSQYVFIKCKSSCRRYSSLSQSLAIMKHTKCNHKYVEKQNAYLSS
jgi:group I intron endonuclease